MFNYKDVVYLTPVTVLFIIIILFLLLWRILKYSINVYCNYKRTADLVNQIPGPDPLPFIGNALLLAVEHDEIFKRLMLGAEMFNPEGIVRGWNLMSPMVFLYKYQYAEVILSNSNHVDKSTDYKYLHPWLGTGLLTSTQRKWHKRRKIVTPAFHFGILETFVDVFWEQSLILSDKLQNEIGKDYFDMFPYVTLCALDIIGETAMGYQIKAQTNSDSEYIQALYNIVSIVQSRQSKFWLRPEFLFQLTSTSKTYYKSLDILHQFTKNIISKRKEEYTIRKVLDDSNNNEEIGATSKRLAFLDLLIEAQQKDSTFTDEGLQEEVDTFMFEGHDTTSSAVNWCLFLIASHPEVQRKVSKELEMIFGMSERKPTMQDIKNMKYLDCCIKESLRLYPTVPMFGRHINEDVKIDKYTIPKNTDVFVMIYMIHRDPAVFPDPCKFIPERFLPENCQQRSAFSFIPFSAGIRNCIGQKYAILEEKVIISTLIRKYYFEAIEKEENLILLGELILRPKNGINLKISKRDENKD